MVPGGGGGDTTLLVSISKVIDRHRYLDTSLLDKIAVGTDTIITAPQVSLQRVIYDQVPLAPPK